MTIGLLVSLMVRVFFFFPALGTRETNVVPPPPPTFLSSPFYKLDMLMKLTGYTCGFSSLLAGFLSEGASASLSTYCAAL